MQGLARYWIFFVIVAVGLVLSWGQVGRKTVQVLAEEEVRYLVAERPCRPRAAPCAASGSDVALVLGPDRSGFRLRSLGLPATAVDALRVEYIDDDGRVLETVSPGTAPPDWLLADVAGATAVRITVHMADRRLVADFPL